MKLKPGWQRVADRLADGRWHSSYELTHELDVMVHSRIANLRSKGFTIDTRRVSGATGLKAFEYLLVATPRAGEPKAPSTSGGLSLDTLRRVDVSSPAPGVDLQLGLWVSAAAPRARHEAAA